ncbi:MULTISPECIES: carbohydrate ABC transporter permease [unclassified Streptomyces]|uniref:carbohydrate ABC transporter permease n=1 Tax=unclassified Streptomyces TaxID=2593676 RepID=UPI00081E1C2D|nr:MULTISPECIES: carbohydrate ABC transporter permease [unclassified Streptomyces]MYR27081.1 ABC transporter permease subunit [Streptomyces sp. SID4945]SCF17522.1 carbohydrate ABC transporter membrane protein 2, CUT1 family [Streptomyces sp. LcepLS]
MTTQPLTTTRPATGAPAPARPPARPGGTKRALGWIAEHALLVALAAVFLVPVVFVVLTSFMGGHQTLTGALWPHPFQWSNYLTAFRTAPLGRWFANSLLYAGVSTILMLVSSVPMAYVLAKVRFKGASILFFAVIIAMLLPPQVTQVPVYVMWAQLRVVGTFWPLILPHLFGNAFSIFLLRQFFLSIPNEYLDAARMDGNGEWGVLTRVMVPMAKPGIAAASIFMFFQCWNDYYGPLLYTSENPDRWTIAYGLASFHGAHSTDWGVIMAVTTLATLPVVLVFFFAQRTFVEGITLTGVKG